MNFKDILVYLFFSMFEWFALIVLTFEMFKFQIRWYRGQIIFTSFILAVISYVVFVALKLQTFASLIQPPIVFLFFWLMFRIAVFYAGIMAANGYLAYTFIQTLVLFVTEQFVNENNSFDDNNFLLDLIQIISVCLASLVAWLIHRYRVGMTFVPDAERVDVKLTGINLRLLLFTVLGYAVIASINFLLFLGGYIYMLFPLAALALGLLQY